MYSNIPLLYCVRWKSLVMSLKVAEQLGNQLRFTVPSHATCITTCTGSPQPVQLTAAWQLTDMRLQRTEAVRMM